MQRIIAYIYRYKEDREGMTTSKEKVFIRCGNAGFCRVEICNDKYAATICFKDVCKVSGRCDIYGLVARKSQNAQNSYEVTANIGAMVVAEGRFSGKVDVSGTDGILIECEAGKYMVMWRETVDRLLLQREILSEVEKAEIIQKEVEKEPEKMQERTNKNESANTIMLERAYNRLCKVRMTIGGKVCQVVKMKPQEIIMLPRSYWRLASNCFLMDGYYTYKHIVFFKYEGDYVLGVPGKGSATESAYAIRFGFCELVTGGEYGRRTSDRTYWLMRLR